MSDHNDQRPTEPMPDEFRELVESIKISKQFRGLIMIALINRARKATENDDIIIIHHSPIFKMIHDLKAKEFAILFINLQNILDDIKEIGLERFPDEFADAVQEVQSTMKIIPEVNGTAVSDMLHEDRKNLQEDFGEGSSQDYFDNQQ